MPQPGNIVDKFTCLAEGHAPVRLLAEENVAVLYAVCLRCHEFAVCERSGSLGATDLTINENEGWEWWNRVEFH